MVWKFDGVWQGEYWDSKAVVSPYKYVSLFHITDPTSPFSGRVPKQGDEVGLYFVDESGRNRSNVVWSTWPLESDK
jgi:hypothetical protein